MTSDSTAPRAFPLRSLLLVCGGLLILNPTGWSLLSGSPGLLATSLIGTLLVMVLQIEVARFFHPWRTLRWVLLPVLCTSTPFLLLALPGPLPMMLFLFAVSWLLAPPGPVRIPGWGRFLILGFTAWNLLSLDVLLPEFAFPRLPSTTPIWIGIGLVIPLGIATQKRLRRFARGVILAEATAVFLAVSLIPPGLQILTGFKEIGEPERGFYRFPPLPGFQSVPGVGNAELIPSEFRKMPDPLLAVRILNQMNQQLQPHRLHVEVEELSSDQVLLWLLQEGLMQRDRYGLYVPPETYRLAAASGNLPEEKRNAITQLADQTSLDLTDFDIRNLLSEGMDRLLTGEELRSTLLRLRNRNLVDTLPGDSSRFRLTPQARHRLDNGWYPRQMLFAARISESPVPRRIRHADYAPGWELPFENKRSELMELAEAGILVQDASWSWHRETRHDVHIALFPLMLGVGTALTGILLIWAGGGCPPSTLLRIVCLAVGMLSVRLLPSLAGPEAPLVVLAVWSTLGLPVAVVMTGIAIR